MNMKNIMIDLETLGVRADSVIMSIGAVKFDLVSGKIDDGAFYTSISVDSNHEAAPRHINESTLVWWLEQSQEAKRVFSEPKTTLFAALSDLKEWVGKDDYRVWSNGADFDIPMLTHAFHTNNLEAPWKFWMTGCYRTMKALPGAPKALKAPKIAHNALDDAIAQTMHLQLIWRELFPTKENT